MEREKKHLSIIHQVAILFAIAVLLIGIITYFGQYNIADSSVRAQAEDLAEDSSEEVMEALEEFPAYLWLLRYWCEHSDELDIEYDVDYRTGAETKEKSRLLSERHPDFQPLYATSADVLALPPEDQKLYAEVAYSWLITRINQIKQTYEIAFLFCARSDDPYDKQFFVFSAADPGAVRGTEYEQVYILGVEKDVTESQQTAMRNARANDSNLADAGNYMDYYKFVGTYDAHPFFIGITYDISALKADTISQTWRRTIPTVIFLICLAIFCLWLIFSFVLRPLRTIQNNIQVYKETKDSETVAANLSEIRSHNEIGRLSDDVVSLSKELDDYMERMASVTAEKERLGTEMALAARIQANSLPNIFPPFPERDEFDIYATMDPAKEVGGDFYDFYMIDDDHLAMVIADVSGKGVPAALFMMISKIMINNASAEKLSPARILETVNDQLCTHNPEEMFVSVWLGILEVSTGKVTATNAGHEYPAVMHPDGLFDLVKAKHGFILGGMADIEYSEYTMYLEPGAKLFVYTDGVPEATNSEGGMFGMDRMLAALNKNPAGTIENTVKDVRDGVDDFVKDAEQFDDLTMMCLTYIGPKK